MKKFITCCLLCLLSLFIHAATAIAAPSTQPSSNYKYEMTGAEGDVLRNAVERLNQEQREYQNLDPSEIQHLYQQTPKLIQEAVQPFGYFKAKVQGKLTYNNKTWIAHYPIQLGPALKITKIQLSITGEGMHNPNMQKWITDFPLHTGDVFATKSYSQAKQFLIEKAVQQSYITAHYTENQVNINLSHYQANIVLNLDTGPRYFFGPVSFSPTHFSQHFLQRFINYKIGDPYSASKLKELQKRFNDSNYFQEIEIIPDLEPSNHLHVPVHIKLKPTKSKEYLMGLGYGTDTGARGQLSFKFPQLGHNGEQVKGLIKASHAYSKLIASYSIPGTDPVTSHYTLSASMEHQTQNIGKSTTAALIASYITQLRNNWEQTLSLNLMNDQSTIVNTNNTASNLLLFPSINWLKLKTDDLLNPNNGYRLAIGFLGAPETTLSSMRFLQAQISVKSVHRVSDNNRLVLHGTLGHTEVSDLNRLPLSLRFYTGGSQSIRGYSYRSIGPGRELTEASIELQHHIYKSWYVGIFYDAGNVNDRLLPNLKRGIGTGLIWLSPVGAVQLSLAKALDAPGKPLRIQFNMGPDL